MLKCNWIMKVFAVGFNLYKQFDKAQTVLEEFTEVYTGIGIKDICMSYSLSFLQISDNVFQIHPKNVTKEIDSGILKLCCNNDRLLIIDQCHKVHKIDFKDLDRDLVPHKEIPMGSEEIKNGTCGSKLVVLYTNTGNLFNTFEKLHFQIPDIIDIQCGREHCLILDSKGTVYTFGQGSRGQLGHTTLDDEREPLQVEALAGLNIIQISAGGWHSCAVTKDGDLYTWGWNGSGQLGICDKTENQHQVIATPTPAEFGLTVLKVACGSRHTIILLDNNQLYGCGWNKYKQIKYCEQESFSTFLKMRSFEDNEIIDIKCGPWNSVVLCA
ncbi:unnamed protein product [Acanthoscelides obtectus]|uniref:RCC1 domain-containing protein 1 n=1 Tax=Acanthoscelides obtectus TaxID=200917 RepID=A0A9P0P0R8_ACAOB|nr:unnamed protein product [Acanthoscelides obtectus]CAK1623838.1 RCC1 domain-containing protein 1 [Acanthoscelides obtectus]